KGVAQALGGPFETVQIEYDWAVRLPNLIRGASLFGIAPAAQARLRQEPWPDLVIAAGRRMAPAARWLKRASGCALVRIMAPGWPGRGDFVLIAIPEHDRAQDGPNILSTAGAPYRPLPELSAEQRAHWTNLVGDLPRPWLLVVVGGSNKNYPFDAALARELMA